MGKTWKQIKMTKRRNNAEHTADYFTKVPKGRGSESKPNGGTPKLDNMFRRMGSTLVARKMQKWVLEQHEIQKPSDSVKRKQLERQFERDRKRDQKNEKERLRILKTKPK